MIATPTWNFYYSFVVLCFLTVFLVEGRSQPQWIKSFSIKKTHSKQRLQHPTRDVFISMSGFESSTLTSLKNGV